jgi:hypothetical protein
MNILCQKYIIIILNSLYFDILCPLMQNQLFYQNAKFEFSYTIKYTLKYLLKDIFPEDVYY